MKAEVIKLFTINNTFKIQPFGYFHNFAYEFFFKCILYLIIISLRLINKHLLDMLHPNTLHA